MILYIGAYGMTILRLTTSAFMLFLSIVFVSIILRIFITKINIIKTSLIAAGCIILTLGTINVNKVCAKYNYEQYVNKNLKTIDVAAIYQLGDEGIPYIIKLTKDNDETISLQAKEYLAKAYYYDYFDGLNDKTNLKKLKQNQKYKELKYFTIPKKNAYDELYNYIEKNPDFIKIIEILAEGI